MIFYNMKINVAEFCGMDINRLHQNVRLEFYVHAAGMSYPMVKCFLVREEGYLPQFTEGNHFWECFLGTSTCIKWAHVRG